jgi:hypothetical protein
VIHQKLLIRVKLNQVSLQSLLQHYLLDIIFKGELGQRLEKHVGELTTPDIPVYRLKSFEQYTYRCSVAFAVAKWLSISPWEVAEQVWQGICQNQLDCSDTKSLAFQVQLVAPGWLEFQLSHPLAWLDFVVHHPPPSGSCKLDQEHDLFLAQYAHARCCSLLRLAQRQNLIEFNDLRPGKGWISPILSNSNTRSRIISEYLPDSTERQLLGTLMMVIDGSDYLSPGEAIQHLKALSQGLLDFDVHCRIWGEVQKDNPQLVQIRLVLLAGVQFWLRWLLESRVGVVAPVEL